MPKIIVKNAVPRFQDYRFNDEIVLEIENKDNVAIIGPNGAGKSMLIDIMIGNIAIKEGKVEISKDGKIVPRNKIVYMSFRDIYRMSDSTGRYYQQRWNATETDESPIVADILKINKYQNAGKLIDKFNIGEIINKRLIFLSSGELRKMQIFKSLLTEPELLIIDNPYIGLDAESRDIINHMLANLSKQQELQVILVLSNPNEIPNWINKVIPVIGKICNTKYLREVFFEKTELLATMFPETVHKIDKLPCNDIDDDKCEYTNAIIMKNVSVRYFTKQILKDVDWTVKRGEKWALLGKNGCGKSTLLSLVCGDNPQRYANDITLFDRKRGSGESIWEIKRNIGYLSPDMHTYYQENIPCIDVVASGFFDTIGLYRKPNDEQRKLAKRWLTVFNAEHLAERSFLQISYGEQRLILLTRVFVKTPSLVILDEPLHGLDAGKKILAKQVIEKYCSNKKVTLIYVTHYTHEIPECVTLTKTLVKPE